MQPSNGGLSSEPPTFNLQLTPFNRGHAATRPLHSSAKVALTVVVMVFSSEDVSLFPSQLVAVE